MMGEAGGIALGHKNSLSPPAEYVRLMAFSLFFVALRHMVQIGFVVHTLTFSIRLATR